MAPPKRTGKTLGKRKAGAAKHLVAPPPDDESSISDASDMVDDDYGERTFLLAAGGIGEEDGKPQRKRRRQQKHDEEADDEKPREMPGKKTLEDPSQKLHFLLPVKSSEGVQMRYRQVEDVGQSEKVAQIAQEKTAKKTKSATVVPEVKPFATDPRWKQRIASLAFDVLEDPEKNLRCVKEIQNGLSEINLDPQISIALMASLTEVFKDILPGYRIHVASEIEQDQQMKKETLQLRQYEEELLGVYQKFLQQLEKIISVIYGKNELSSGELSKAGSAVKCLSELLVTRIDFNFRKNLIESMVHITTCRFAVLVEISINTIQRIFQQDREGGATADVMTCISRMAKVKGHRVTSSLLDVFLYVKVSKELLKSLAEEKEKMAKMDRKLLSFKERKQKKEVAKVEKEMQNHFLVENKKLKGKLHSQIIQSIFAIFFRILKNDDKMRKRLLPSVLRGVAKFVHFIGVEFFDDLVKMLNGIVESDECKPLEKLLCVGTVFSILSGDGSALNIDPHKFYEHLFQVLYALEGTEDRALFIELLHCIQKGFIERRKLISADRAARCAKGVALLALRSSTKEGVSLALLLKSLFVAHPSLDRYLDAEFVVSSVVAGSDGGGFGGTGGVGGMGAMGGPLWEVHQLRRHHHPACRALVDALLGNPKALTSTFSRLLHCDPVEYLADPETDKFDV